MRVQLFYQMTQMYVFCYYIKCIHFRITSYLNFGWDMEQEMPSDLFQFMRCMVHVDILKAQSYLKAHIITGCDVTSKSGMKGRALKAFPEDYFQSFGEKEFVTDEEIRLFGKYLIKVLYPGSKCKSFVDLRVESYMHKNISLTSCFIEGHILRYFYIVR